MNRPIGGWSFYHAYHGKLCTKENERHLQACASVLSLTWCCWFAVDRLGESGCAAETQEK